MLPQTGVKVVFGSGTIGDASDPIVGFSSPEATQEVLNIFRAHGGNELDSSRHYSPNAQGTSEPLIGQTDAREWAKISTKVWSKPGDHTTAGINQSINEQLAALKSPTVYIDYLHHPDPQTPFEETLAAMTAAHGAGKIEHFGLSNFSVDQVREILALCKEKGYLKPAVYQGQYNAIARRAEDELLPLLRENGIKFYAWSPAASGFLSGKGMKSQSNDTLSKIMQNAYAKPEIAAAIKRLNEHADQRGITGHGVALRWALHHSALKGENGDAIVVGARTLNQMNSTMEICGAGPLPQDIVELVEEIWTTLEKVAPGFTPAWE